MPTVTILKYLSVTFCRSNISFSVSDKQSPVFPKPQIITITEKSFISLLTICAIMLS